MVAISEEKTGRTQEIRDAVRTMLDVIQEWNDSDVEYFTERVETAVSASLNVILNGDVPAESLAVFAKVVTLGEIWARVLDGEDGMVGRDGTPARPFWDSLNELREAFERVEVQAIGGIEPVADLLAQMKDYPHKYDQIARMYGRYDAERDRWTGPFWAANGTPAIQLIEQEGKNPGSVVPPGYNPLSEQQKETRAVGLTALAKVRQQLAEAGRGKPVDKDRATVEQLLREGQFPDVIASVKGVSEKAVRATAAQLGIVIKEREEILNEAYAKMIAGDRERSGDQAYLDGMTAMPQLTAEPHLPAELPTAANDNEAGDGGDDGGDEPTALTGEDLRAFVESAASDNPDITASAVVAMIRDDGMTASAINVGRILSAAKKAAANA